MRKYTCGNGEGMFEHSTGEWVKHSDVIELQAKLTKLEAVNRELVEVMKLTEMGMVSRQLDSLFNYLQDEHTLILLESERFELATVIEQALNNAKQ